MIVLWENIFNIMGILLVSLFRIIMYWHYFNHQGRSEIVKKYGFIPSKSQLESSSSDSDSSSCEEEQSSMMNFKTFFFVLFNKIYINDE